MSLNLSFTYDYLTNNDPRENCQEEKFKNNKKWIPWKYFSTHMRWHQFSFVNFNSDMWLTNVFVGLNVGYKSRSK